MCSMKFPIKQMPCPRNVLSTKCPVYEISYQTNDPIYDMSYQ